LTRVICIVVLAACLMVGAAALSILGRDSLPEAGGAMVNASASVEATISNRESKGDKLTVVAAIPAWAVPSGIGVVPGEPVRQAFAASVPTQIEGLNLAEVPPPPPGAAKSKPAGKLPPQKPYALLSDAQIANIKERLKLTASQETYWPAVENALRAVARKIHAMRQTDPNGGGTIIDPDAEEVQQLKSAAMPLLFQLREDQKREVRMLARLIGLEKVAAAI
jgi:hypothetical protein